MPLDPKAHMIDNVTRDRDGTRADGAGRTKKAAETRRGQGATYCAVLRCQLWNGNGDSGSGETSAKACGCATAGTRPGSKSSELRKQRYTILLQSHCTARQMPYKYHTATASRGAATATRPYSIHCALPNSSTAYLPRVLPTCPRPNTVNLRHIHTSFRFPLSAFPSAPHCYPWRPHLANCRSPPASPSHILHNLLPLSLPLPPRHIPFRPPSTLPHPTISPQCPPRPRPRPTCESTSALTAT